MHQKATDERMRMLLANNPNTDKCRDGFAKESTGERGALRRRMDATDPSGAQVVGSEASCGSFGAGADASWLGLCGCWRGIKFE